MKEKGRETAKAINERLQLYVTKKGDTLFGLSRFLGLSTGYFSRVMANNADIGSTIMARILNYYKDLSADWLFTGQGSMLRGKISMTDEMRYGEKQERIKTIKKLSQALSQTQKELADEIKKLY